jgi:hypothetical protein
VKKPLKPSQPARDDQIRHELEMQRQETLSRLERALKEATPGRPPKRKPGDPLDNGDPYNSAGPTPDAWSHGPKR